MAPQLDLMQYANLLAAVQHLDAPAADAALASHGFTSAQWEAEKTSWKTTLDGDVAEGRVERPLQFARAFRAARRQVGHATPEASVDETALLSSIALDDDPLPFAPGPAVHAGGRSGDEIAPHDEVGMTQERRVDAESLQALPFVEPLPSGHHDQLTRSLEAFARLQAALVGAPSRPLALQAHGVTPEELAEAQRYWAARFDASADELLRFRMLVAGFRR